MSSTALCRKIVVLTAVAGAFACASSSAVAATPSYSGAKKVAVILMDFQNDHSRDIEPELAKQRLFTDPDSTAAFYNQATSGALTLTGRDDVTGGDVYGWYRADFAASCSTTPTQIAEEADRQVELDDGSLAGYDYFLYVTPQIPCTSIAGQSAGAGTNRLFVYAHTPFYLPRIATHEFGHNFGLAHADSRSCSIDGIASAAQPNATCETISQGDDWDPMGRAADSRMFSALRRAMLGFTEPVVASEFRQYTIKPAADTTASTDQLLVIPKPGSTNNYYLDFRQFRAPFDDYSNADPVVNGVGIRQGPPIAQPATGNTQLITASPNVEPGGYGPLAGPQLRVGRSFYEPSGPFTIRTVSVSAEGAVVDYIEGSPGAPTPVSITNGALAITSGTNQASDIGVALTNGRFRVIDNGGPLEAGAGCTTVTSSQVTCLATGVSELNVSLGDLNDSISLKSVNLPSNISGGEGHDIIVSGDGNDVLRGNDGDDALYGNGGDDVLDGSVGSDIFSGGSGMNTLDYGSRSEPLTLNLDFSQTSWVGGALGELDAYYGGPGQLSRLIGGAGPDSITGSPGAEEIIGGPGMDTINAGGGDDHIRSADGGMADAVFCGEGNNDSVKRDSADSTDLDCESLDQTPDTSIDSAPRTITGSPNVSFAFSSSLSAATFECRIDDGSYSACTSPLNLTLSDGAHQFRVRAVVGGEVDASPAQRNFTVDVTSPQTTITTGAVLSAVSSPSIEFTSNESGSLFECKFDAAEFEVCGSPHQVASLGAGEHTFAVRAIDSVGNVDASPASISFTTAPTGVSVQGDTLIYSAVPGAADNPQITADESYVQVRIGFDAVVAAGYGCFPESAALILCPNNGIARIEVGLGDLVDSVNNNSGLPAEIDGGAGNDLLVGSTAADIFRGGAGDDQVYYQNHAGPLHLSLDGLSNDGTFVDGASIENDLIGTDIERIAGSNGNDTIIGNAQPDFLNGGGGDDVLLGGDGNDTIAAGEGADMIHGEAGYDRLFGYEGNDTLFGGTEGDELFGGDPYGYVISGNDTLVPGGGNDWVTAGDGDDSVRSRDFESDFINCGNGSDSVRAESIDNFISGECELEAPAIDTTITDGPADGVATSGPSATYSFSAAEPDHTFECSFDASDYSPCSSPHTVVATTAEPHTFAVRSVDPDFEEYVDPTAATRSFTPILSGVMIDSGVLKFLAAPGEGGYVSFYQSGSIYTVYSSNPLPAASGCTSVTAHEAACPTALVSSAEIRMGDGDDTVFSSLPVPTDMFGDAGNDTLNSGSANDRVYGGVGEDWLYGGGGSNLLRGEDGFDWANYTSAPSSVRVTNDDVPDDGIDGGTQQDDVGSDLEAIQLSAFDDNFPGSESSVIVVGGAGNDSIVGSPASDGLYGEAGSDTIDGDTGNDSLIAGDGDDLVRARDGVSDYILCGDGADIGVIDASDSHSGCEVASPAPDTNITGGPSEGSSVSNATSAFSFTATEPGADFECRIDAGAFTACLSPASTGALTDGAHTFAVRAVETATGTVDPTPASRTFTVDTIAPQTTISAPAPTPTSDSTPTWSFVSSESGTTFACKIEPSSAPGSNQLGPCSGPGSVHTASALPDGSYTFSVAATDVAGNADSSPATANVEIDSTGPTTTITAGPANGVTVDVPTVSFAFQASEPASTFECAIDGAAFSSCTTPKSQTLSAGSHSFAVRATDPLGNLGAATPLRAFTVALPGTLNAAVATFSSPTNLSSPAPTDWVHWGRSVATDVNRKSGTSIIGTFQTLPTPTGVPVSRVTSGAPTFSWTGGTPTVSSSTAAGVAVGAVKDRGFRLTVPASTSATRTLKVYVGVTSTTGRLVASLSDGSSPSVTNTSVTSSTSSPVNRVFTINYRSYTPGATLTVSWTKDTTSTSSSSTVRLYAANLTSMTDVTAPETTITSGPANNATVTTTTASFGLSSSEPTGARFQCKFDNQLFNWCTNPFVTPSLTTGSHSVQFRAVDAAGNFDLTPATRTFNKN